MLAFFGFAGPWEVLIVLVIILLLFGGKRVPEVMRSLGQSVVEFKKGIKAAEDESPEESSASSGGDQSSNQT